MYTCTSICAQANKTGFTLEYPHTKGLLQRPTYKMVFQNFLPIQVSNISYDMKIMSINTNFDKFESEH